MFGSSSRIQKLDTGPIVKHYLEATKATFPHIAKVTGYNVLFCKGQLIICKLVYPKVNYFVVVTCSLTVHAHTWVKSIPNCTRNYLYLGGIGVVTTPLT